MGSEKEYNMEGENDYVVDCCSGFQVKAIKSAMHARRLANQVPSLKEATRSIHPPSMTNDGSTRQPIDNIGEIQVGNTMGSDDDYNHDGNEYNDENSTSKKKRVICVLCTVFALIVTHLGAVIIGGISAGKWSGLFPEGSGYSKSAGVNNTEEKEEGYDGYDYDCDEEDDMTVYTSYGSYSYVQHVINDVVDDSPLGATVGTKSSKIKSIKAVTAPPPTQLTKSGKIKTNPDNLINSSIPSKSAKTGGSIVPPVGEPVRLRQRQLRSASTATKLRVTSVGGEMMNRRLPRRKCQGKNTTTVVDPQSEPKPEPEPVASDGETAIHLGNHVELTPGGNGTKAEGNESTGDNLGNTDDGKPSEPPLSPAVPIAVR